MKSIIVIGISTLAVSLVSVMLFLRIIKDSIGFAIHALIVNKLRTILSLLGITIGIFAIISVFTVLDALENNLRNSISSLGSNIVFIQKWPWSFDGDYAWWKYMKRPQASVSEMEEVQRMSQSAEACVFQASGRQTVQFENNMIEGVDIVAVSQDFNKVKDLEIASGRYFSDTEANSGRPIAIIGDAVAKALFGPRDPIGKRIKVFGRKLRVIGVIKREGESILGGSVDTQVILPVNYSRNIFDLKRGNLNPTIMVKAKEGISNEEMIAELSGIMRSIRKLKPKAEDNFAINEVSVLNKQFDSIFGIIGTVGWIIGGFSILVGGFGIANIMFVSVKERTAQIGIHKALGARNYFILLQFLTESIMLSLIGGLLGLLLIFIGTFFSEPLFDIEVSLTRSNVILGLTISALIGIISGFIPSYSASQLDPVEAIRSKG